MGRLLNIVTPLHKMTKRDYVGRMMDDKVHCMLKAKEYEADYWDGDRRYGYGGYRYIEGRWKPVAQALVDLYGLKGKVPHPRCRLRQGLPAARVQAAAAGGRARRLRHLAPRPRRRASRRKGRALPLPRAGPLSVRRQVVRPRRLARHPAQSQDLRARDGPRRDRARRQERLRHGRELPQRARAVQHGVLGAHRRSLPRHRRVDLALSSTSATPATTSSSISSSYRGHRA